MILLEMTRLWTILQQNMLAMGYVKEEYEGGRSCLECGRAIYGRTDKVYCGDSCRSRHFARAHAYALRIRRKVNSQLDRNYEILSRLLADGKTGAELSDLKMEGFDPYYVTAHRKDARRHDECCCFELVYCCTDNRIFNLRRMQTQNPPTREGQGILKF